MFVLTFTFLTHSFLLTSNFLQSFLFAIQHEMLWWVRINIHFIDCHQRRRLPRIDTASHRYSIRDPLTLPRTDWDSMTSWTEWKLYFQRVKMRVWPAVFEYQTILSIQYLLQTLLKMVVSEKSMQRLTQHPYQRALVVARADKGRVAVAWDSFVTCLWCNALFFSANFLFGGVMIGLNYRATYQDEYMRAPTANVEPHRRALLQSWRLLTTTLHRYYYSSAGAMIGSGIWPGAGTLVGMWLGDGFGEIQDTPAMPDFGRMRRLLKGLWKQLTMMSWQKKSTGNDNSSWRNDEDEHINNPYKAKDMDDSLMCGCCQTTMFSSDPSCPERAPVSSRECSHTICKLCVQKCHLALMERTQTYQQWISCPLCKAMNAFSSHNHLINRSLCSAIALIEQQSIEQQAEPTQPLSQRTQSSETQRSRPDDVSEIESELVDLENL